MKTPACILSAATLLAAPSLSADTINWTTGTSGDASGAWNNLSFNGQSYTTADTLVINGTTGKTITVGTATTIPTKFSITGNASSLSGGSLVVSSATATKASFTGTSYSGGIASEFFLDTVGQTGSINIGTAIDFGSPGAATTYGLVMQNGAFTNTLSGNLTGGSNVNLWFDVSATANPPLSTWILSGNNTEFDGNIRLNRGNIQFENVASLGGAGTLFVQTNGSATAGVVPAQGNLTFNFSGAEKTVTLSKQITLQNNGGAGGVYLDTKDNHITLSSTFSSGLGLLNKTGTGSLTLTDVTNAVTVATTIADGTIRIAGAGRYNSGAYAQALTLTNTTSVFDYASSASQTLSGVISGAGKITKSGTGALTLSGNNTYTGGITATAGTIRVSTNNTALGTGALTITSATVNTSTSVLLATASGGGARTLANNVAINNNGTGTSTLNLDGGFAALTLNGVISGNGNVATTSSGTVTLGGVNTYTGMTTVGGNNTLVLANSGALQFLIGANGINNSISGTGTLVLDGTFNFDLTSASAVLGDSWQIVNNATLTETYSGTFAVGGGFSDGDNDNVWTFTNGSGIEYSFAEATGTLSVTAVPEPSIALLGGLGVLGLLRRRRA